MNPASALLLATLAATPAPAPVDAVTLDNQGCMGSCPVYQVTVHADGRVHYRGERHVASTGERTASTSPRAARRLIRRVARFRPRPGRLCRTDDVTTETRLQVDGQLRVHDNDHGWCPSRAALRVRALDRKIKRVAGVRRWTKPTRDCRDATFGGTVHVALEAKTLDDSTTLEIDRLFLDAFAERLARHPEAKLEVWTEAPDAEASAARTAATLVVEALARRDIAESRVIQLRVDDGDDKHLGPPGTRRVVLRAGPERCVGGALDAGGHSSRAAGDD